MDAKKSKIVGRGEMILPRILSKYVLQTMDFELAEIKKYVACSDSIQSLCKIVVNR